MIETKALGAAHSQISDDFASTFAAFRQANDERLNAIEQKSVVDPLLDAKVDRLNKRLETLSARMTAPAAATSAETETKSAWSRFIRSGDDSALTELKALSTGEGDGGYIAPMETESRIDAVLAASSPFRSIATVRKIGTGTFRKPISQSESASGWTGESDPMASTTAPDLTLVDFPVGELYAMPAATQSLLDDSVADVDGWLADEVRDVFAAQETAAFVNGGGVNKPKGFLTYQGGSNALPVVKTGVDGDLGDGHDALINLIYAPESRY
ncbi:MAG: phage major capsid protein, partial [Pseudomonadota bacterium]